jgi:outer membrane protein assembly factor BamB
MRHLKWGLLLCAVLLSGCSFFSKKTGQEPMELESFKETAKLNEVWSRGVGMVKVSA